MRETLERGPQELRVPGVQTREDLLQGSSSPGVPVFGVHPGTCVLWYWAGCVLLGVGSFQVCVVVRQTGEGRTGSPCRTDRVEVTPVSGNVCGRLQVGGTGPSVLNR